MSVTERLLKVISITQNNENLTWKFDTSSYVSLFKHATRGDVFRSNEFNLNGCTFYLELTPNGWGKLNGAIVWCALKALPEEYIAASVQFKYKCDDISFEGSKTQILTTKDTQVSNIIGHSMSLDNTMEPQQFANLNSFTFECTVNVIALYNQNDLQKIVAASGNNNVNNNEFIKTITWKFNTESDLQLFQDSKHDNIINSPVFALGGCKFHLELTPNGWGEFEGTMLWCALDELPQQYIAVKVIVKQRCDAAGFVDERQHLLSTQLYAAKIKGASYSATSANGMEFAKFKGLNSFGFECNIQIIAFYDQNGNQYNAVQNNNGVKMMPVKQNGNIVAVHFHDPLDVKLFKNATHGTIIRSDYFTINKCELCLEITPNGWNTVTGTSMVWCAVYKLPENVGSIGLNFKYKCDGVSFKAEKMRELTTKILAATNNKEWSTSPDKAINHQMFANLNSFIFECEIDILAFYDKNGNKIQMEINNQLMKPTVQAHNSMNNLDCKDDATISDPQDVLKEYGNLITKIKKYKKRIDGNVDDIVESLDEFHKLLEDKHQTKKLEIICDSLGFCDIAKCNMFIRNYRERQDDKDILYADTEFVARCQILDKIHCFVSHSYDVGNRRRNNEYGVFDERFNQDGYFVLSDNLKSATFATEGLPGVHDYQKYPTCRVFCPISISYVRSQSITFKLSEYGWFGIGSDTIKPHGFAGYTSSGWMIRVIDGASWYNDIQNAAGHNSIGDLTGKMITMKYSPTNKQLTVITEQGNEHIYTHKDMPPSDKAYFVFSMKSGKVEIFDSADEKLASHANNALKTIKNRSNRYNQFSRNKPKENNQFIYGWEFHYDWEGTPDEKQIDDYKIHCSPAHTNLKQEITQNNIYKISLVNFNAEYTKAGIHFESRYRKDKFPYKDIALEHLLALMIYCNFDTLSAEFSTTYREHDFRKHFQFYYLGKLLKELILKFGTEVRKGQVETFYHGINKKLIFAEVVGDLGKDVRMHCPLSTSASFEVAMNFADHNNGFVIEFGGSRDTRYFSCAWLSDFQNESECLFLQNKHELQIKNIIDCTPYLIPDEKQAAIIKNVLKSVSERHSTINQLKTQYEQNTNNNNNKHADWYNGNRLKRTISEPTPIIYSNRLDINNTNRAPTIIDDSDNDNNDNDIDDSWNFITEIIDENKVNGKSIKNDDKICDEENGDEIGDENNDINVCHLGSNNSNENVNGVTEDVSNDMDVYTMLYQTEKKLPKIENMAIDDKKSIDVMEELDHLLTESISQITFTDSHYRLFEEYFGNENNSPIIMSSLAGGTSDSNASRESSNDHGNAKQPENNETGDSNQENAFPNRDNSSSSGSGGNGDKNNDDEKKNNDENKDKDEEENEEEDEEDDNEEQKEEQKQETNKPLNPHVHDFVPCNSVPYSTLAPIPENVDLINDNDSSLNVMDINDDINTNVLKENNNYSNNVNDNDIMEISVENTPINNKTRSTNSAPNVSAFSTNRNINVNNNTLLYATPFCNNYQLLQMPMSQYEIMMQIIHAKDLYAMRLLGELKQKQTEIQQLQMQMQTYSNRNINDNIDLKQSQLNSETSTEIVYSSCESSTFSYDATKLSSEDIDSFKTSKSSDTDVSIMDRNIIDMRDSLTEIRSSLESLQTRSTDIQRKCCSVQQQTKSAVLDTQSSMQNVSLQESEYKHIDTEDHLSASLPIIYSKKLIKKVIPTTIIEQIVDPIDYMNKHIKICGNNAFIETSGGQHAIIDFKFHSKNKESLYVVADKTKGNKWKLKHELYYGTDVETKFNVSIKSLKTQLICKEKVEDTLHEIKNMLNDKEKRNRITGCKYVKWETIVIHAKQSNTPLSQTMTDAEFSRRLRKFSNNSNMNLVPIVTFKEDKSEYCIEIIWIVDVGCNIGIALHVENKKLIVSGIYLDIYDNHLLVPYKHECNGLNYFHCKIDDLTILTDLKISKSLVIRENKLLKSKLKETNKSIGQCLNKINNVLDQQQHVEYKKVSS